MSVLRIILTAILVIEVVAAGFFVTRRLNRPTPPTVNADRLDPLTARDLARLRQQAEDGGAVEWQRLAEGYLGNGCYVAAEQCFRCAADLDPQNLQAHYGQGFCLDRVGHTSDAIAVLADTAQRADPELARTCWYQIGRCYLREENAEQAEAAFRRTASFPPAAFQLAKLYIRSGRADEAVAILDEQLDILPNSLKLIQLRMHAAKAVHDSDRVSTLRQREERARYQLELGNGQRFVSMFSSRHGLPRMLSTAMWLKDNGTLPQRKAALDNALSVIVPNELWQYGTVLIAAAYVELGLRNLPRAAELLEEINKYLPDSIDAREIEAQLAAARGDINRTYEIRSAAAQLKPSADLFADLAVTPVRIDPVQRAEYRARQQLLTALAMWRNNQTDEARKMLESVAEVLLSDERVFFYLGEARRLSGDHQGAEIAYKQCLEINPDHGRAIERLNDAAAE